MDVVRYRTRRGDVQDVKRIHELGKELMGSVYPGMKMNDVKFKTTVANCMFSKSGCCFVVVDESDVPAGFILGVIDTPFYSDQRFATDLAFYVRPEARSYGAWLASRFINWGKSVPGVTEITMAISSGIGDVDRIGRMYEKKGMRRMGGLYTMRVQSAGKVRKIG
jgi:hypothetical protein